MDTMYIAMLLLTLTGDGAIRMTLTEAEDAADCAASADMVNTILTSSGNPVIALRCGTTALRLSPFYHGTPPEEEIHRYRVTLPAESGFAVTPLGPQDSCAPAPASTPAVFCTRSAQAPEQ